MITRNGRKQVGLLGMCSLRADQRQTSPETVRYQRVSTTAEQQQIACELGGSWQTNQVLWLV